MKGKFNILSMQCTDMQREQALEPVSRRANLLNLNQISEMITVTVMSLNVMWLLWRMRNIMKKFFWNHIYDCRVSIEHVPVLRLH
jgi:hypothetical protein